MKFCLDIECDNAAFFEEDERRGTATVLEVADILAGVVAKLRGLQPDDLGTLRDCNGNSVGWCGWTGDPMDDDDDDDDDNPED